MKNRPRPGWRTRSRNGTRFPQALISSYEILQQHWEITYRENSSSHDVREEDRMQQLRAATSSYEINNTSANTDANTQCSRRRQNFVSHEAESFVQRECDVTTARPIAQKSLSAFASVNRRHAKLGSVLLSRTQQIAPSPSTHVRKMLRGFLQMTRRRNGVRNSRNLLCFWPNTRHVHFCWNFAEVFSS